MNRKITPHRLSGHISAIDSKSHGHRLLIASALSEIQKPDGRIQRGIDAIHFTNPSLDIDATIQCLKQLDNANPIFHCNESGSTLRFLVPVAMVLKERATFVGEGRLLERPLSPLKEEMEAHGCQFDRDLDRSKQVEKSRPCLLHWQG